MEETKMKELSGGKRKKKSSSKKGVAKKIPASSASLSRSKNMTAKKKTRSASSRSASMRMASAASKANPTGNILVGLVYADWCGHCQQMKPEWAKMKEELSPMRNIDVVEINSDDMPSALDRVRDRYGFEMEQPQGYPHIFRWNGGPNVNTYEGARTASAMKGWAKMGGKAVGGKAVGGKAVGGNVNKINHSISSNGGSNMEDKIPPAKKESSWFSSIFG